MPGGWNINSESLVCIELSQQLRALEGDINESVDTLYIPIDKPEDLANDIKSFMP